VEEWRSGGVRDLAYRLADFFVTPLLLNSVYSPTAVLDHNRRKWRAAYHPTPG